MEKYILISWCKIYHDLILSVIVQTRTIWKIAVRQCQWMFQQFFYASLFYDQFRATRKTALKKGSCQHCWPYFMNFNKTKVLPPWLEMSLNENSSSLIKATHRMTLYFLPVSVSLRLARTLLKKLLRKKFNFTHN